MDRHIYADNAATTVLSHNAFNAMLPYLMKDYGNASQLYSFARNPKKALKEARATIADCIGASPEEIFFTSCGTESDNWAIYGAALKGMDVITSAIEHHAILLPCKHLSSKGLKTKFLPVDTKGIVSVSSLNDAIRSKDTLVSIMLANNEIGSIQPIKELAECAHSKKCLFHTDAVQAVGHIPINVGDLGVDLLSASAHKFNGPKGIGFLYIRKGVSLPQLLIGGSQETGQRAGTENVAAIVAMAVALQENVSAIEANTKHLLSLENLLLSTLVQYSVAFVRNGAENHIPGNISLSFQGHSGEAIMHRLDLKGIYVSTGSACNSQKTTISHVLESMHISPTLAQGTIRISFGKDNFHEDALHIALALKQIIT